MTAEDWVVRDGYGGQVHVFAAAPAALAYAHEVARSDRPTIVVAPDGTQTLVIRVDPRVQIQAVRPLTGGAP